MLTDRGVSVDHTTILTGGCRKSDPETDRHIRWYRQISPLVSDSSRVDETYIRVGGRWCYLYRVVAKDGLTLDFYMSTRRITAAATRFRGKALRSASHRGPGSGRRVICTDKAPTYTGAITEVIDKKAVGDSGTLAGEVP